MYPSIVAVVLGTLGALFPEAMINWSKRVMLGPSFENAADLRPRDWYVRTVRFESVLLALAGVAWLALKRRRSDTETASMPDLTPGEEEPIDQ